MNKEDKLEIDRLLAKNSGNPSPSDIKEALDIINSSVDDLDYRTSVLQKAKDRNDRIEDILS